MIVLGCVTNNILTMYSSGLCLQAIGIPLQRSITVLFDGVLGVAIACYALFVSDFTSTLSSLLEVSVALLGPAITIYATDIVLRRNRYDGGELHNETPTSQFWFSGGVNWAGFGALFVGTAAAALWLNTTHYVGPLAARFEGADLSSFVGPVVAMVVYAGLVKLLYPVPPRRRACAAHGGTTARRHRGLTRPRREPRPGLAPLLHQEHDEEEARRGMRMTRDLADLYAAAYRRLVVQLDAICGDLAEAEDAVQEAFVTAVGKSHQLGEVSDPEAWVRKVALRKLHGVWRHRAVVRKYQAAVPGPQTEPEVMADHVALVTALAALDPDQRLVVVLHHLADLGTAEIAGELEIPEGTVKSRLSRGRSRLARLLDEREEPHRV